MTSASICIEQPGVPDKGTARPFPTSGLVPAQAPELGISTVWLCLHSTSARRSTRERNPGCGGRPRTESLPWLLLKLQRKARGTKTLRLSPPPQPPPRTSAQEAGEQGRGLDLTLRQTQDYGPSLLCNPMSVKQGW